MEVAKDLCGLRLSRKSDQTRSSAIQRIRNGLTFDPAATFDAHQLSDSRVITVPMVDFTGANGHSPIPVKGFAEPWLVSVNNSADVTTYFIEQTAPNTTARWKSS